jgi:hypothetical protein
MLIDLFDAANAQITAVGTTVGQSPQQYNNAIFTLMENISNNVILPIAALIITGILCYELITMVTEKNNMADIDTFMFFKYLFKACIAVFLLSNVFVIVNGVFDISAVLVQGVVTQFGATQNELGGYDYSLLQAMYDNVDGQFSIGALFLMFLTGLIVRLIMFAVNIIVFIILIGRFMEMYVYCSIAPIPFATFANREWGAIGTNYIKNIVALTFQAFFIMVLVAIYGIMVSAVDFTDVLGSLAMSACFAICLCMMLFKTSAISKSIFTAH